jgi:hypothetical protein
MKSTFPPRGQFFFGTHGLNLPLGRQIISEKNPIKVSSDISERKEISLTTSRDFASENPFPVSLLWKKDSGSQEVRVGQSGNADFLGGPQNADQAYSCANYVSDDVLFESLKNARTFFDRRQEIESGKLDLVASLKSYVFPLENFEAGIFPPKEVGVVLVFKHSEHDSQVVRDDANQSRSTRHTVTDHDMTGRWMGSSTGYYTDILPAVIQKVRDEHFANHPDAEIAFLYTMGCATPFGEVLWLKFHDNTPDLFVTLDPLFKNHHLQVFTQDELQKTIQEALTEYKKVAGDDPLMG